MACEVKALLLVKLSSASIAHAQQAALLSAIVGTRDPDSFSETMADCEQTERFYEAAKVALAAHRKDHRC